MCEYLAFALVHYVSGRESCSSTSSAFTHALPFCHVRLSGPKPLPKAYPKALKTLGDHLRKRRLDLGLLQKEVAEQIRVDTASIGNWESNETQPMVHCIPRILAFLGHNPLPEADDLTGKLKRLRGTLGLTQEKLAQRLGIDESTVAGWERGENTPVGSYLKLLEDFVAGDGLLPKGPGGTPAKSKLSARKIAALRQKLGLTKAALARQIGINVNTLWRWERGDRKPHGLHRKLIADLMRDSN
jgi:DNA-binding transcriptional regulator YiaG